MICLTDFELHYNTQVSLSEVQNDLSKQQNEIKAGIGTMKAANQAREEADREGLRQMAAQVKTISSEISDAGDACEVALSAEREKCVGELQDPRQR